SLSRAVPCPGPPLLVFCLPLWPLPVSALFPYTTLFRSCNRIKITVIFTNRQIRRTAYFCSHFHFTQLARFCIKDKAINAFTAFSCVCTCIPDIFFSHRILPFHSSSSLTIIASAI